MVGAIINLVETSPMKKPSRIYLSSPHLGSQEFEFVREAFATNWIAPLGPNVDGFEREFSEYVGRKEAQKSQKSRTSDGGWQMTDGGAVIG